MAIQNNPIDDKAFEKMTNVLNSSIAFLGICITIISLFQVMDKRAAYRADDLFSLTAGLFLSSTFASYFYLKTHSAEWLIKLADVFFLSALLSLLVASIYLVLQL